MASAMPSNSRRFVTLLWQVADCVFALAVVYPFAREGKLEWIKKSLAR